MSNQPPTHHGDKGLVTRRGAEPERTKAMNVHISSALLTRVRKALARLTRAGLTRIGATALCLVVCLPISACTPVDRAETALNAALDRLEGNLLNYREVLEDLRKEVSGLPGKAAEIIRHEATDLAKSTIAAAGVELRCNVDFVGQRALEGLERIKALVNGENPPIRPSFCSVTPSTVDLNLEPARRNKVAFSGYNFDAPGVQLVVVNRGAEKVVADQFLTKSTRYEMVANLGGASDDQGIQLTEEAQRLELRWNGQAVSQVGILQKAAPPPCEHKTRLSKATAHTVVPIHTGEGDKELFGKADVWINVSRVVTATTVDAIISMKVRQYDDDHSTAEITSAPIRLYDAPAGTKIVSVGGPEREPELHYRDTDWEDDLHGGGNGLVARYVVKAEGPGEDLNGFAQATVWFNPLGVETIPTSGCRE